MDLQFNEIVESAYALPLEDRQELKNLLEHNIASSRRDEIAKNGREAREEHRLGKLKFSSNIEELNRQINVN